MPHIVRIVLCMIAAAIYPILLLGQRTAPTFPSLQAFLDVCPQNDPYYPILQRDFQILRNGVPVAEIPCTEPVSKMTGAQVTEELAAVQSLRFAYYLDIGRSGYLPWTTLRLYDWFKSHIAGINIDTSLRAGSGAASCCVTIGGRRYISSAPFVNEATRAFSMRPDFLAPQVALIAHEVRHTEGDGYRHVSCCGISFGCDQTYDETNLSPYGIQYYLAKLWLTGASNLGYSCDPQQAVPLNTVFLAIANNSYRRFCADKPPDVPLPALPGGSCVPACVLAPSGPVVSSISSPGGAFTVGIAASTPTCGWTADSADSWITVRSGGNSSGNGAVAYTVASNLSAAPRTGTLLAAGYKLSISQASPSCSLSCPSSVSTSVLTGAPVQFSTAASPPACGVVQYDWDFGDGSPHASTQSPVHSYINSGIYSWALTVSSAPAVCRQTGSIRVDAPPRIDSVVGGAPGPSAIAGGSWVTIHGASLSITTRSWNAADFKGSQLPLSLDGVSVKIGGKDAAVYSISPAQLNVQCPADIAIGSVPVQVTNRIASASGTAAIQTFAPAFFLFGGNYVAAVHADGTYVGESTLFGGAIASRPAEPGETILLFGTGFGPTSPSVIAGQEFTGAAGLTDPAQLTVRIGGWPAVVNFAGITGAGVYQFNVVIPEVASGDRELIAEIAGTSTPSGRFLTISSSRSR
jgi:uncharacterized protein (TIGR03437 family)